MDIIEEGMRKRFEEGASCPYCESKKIQKNGFYREEQRYKCKECYKTFTKETKTLTHGSHYKNKWPEFIKSMENGETLREAGEKINVNYATLHFWRHKILSILNGDNENELNGEVEIIKTTLPYVNKNRNDKRYSKDKNLEKDVNLVLLYQRTGGISSFVYQNSTLPINFLREIEHLVSEKTIFYLPNTHPFRFPMIGLKFKFKDTLKKPPEGCTFYEFKVTRFILDFCHWKFKFNGVSSKYLSKYVSYYKNLLVFKNMREIILNSFEKLCQVGGLDPIIGDVLF